MNHFTSSSEQRWKKSNPFTKRSNFASGKKGTTNNTGNNTGNSTINSTTNSTSKKKVNTINNKPTPITDEYKETVCISASLGEKGYTILKSALTEDDIAFLKSDLTMKPQNLGAKLFISAGASASNNSTDTKFPVWRENDKKMYIPRFYGIHRYGEPAETKIGKNVENIAVTFTKELRDYQINIIDVYMKALNKGTPGSGGGILEVPCGRGKTVMAIKIVADLGVKTLVLVHKEFLMNQWIERFQEFLPDARIGKIQGPIFDIENKDIVIGMIQTMYSRDFPAGAFATFGLTIIDEVHRIGSEEFSKTLLKTVTPYMLGISATVERKDGLAQLLYHFIGPKIYSEERSKDEMVSVRGIEFVSGDPEFSATEYDFRGMPKYSTMISKLCDFGPRTDFIVKTLMDLFVENPDIQVMVLAHNRSLLKGLYDRILYRDFATVGYYVGGMKEIDLKATEEKQIVLATYAMAAEALDIKSLSVLIMASPKTDIEQSVGRILRSKHDNPIVIDIIDSHDTFQNQWRSRKKFYKKCNYRILYTKSTQYMGFPCGFSETSGWKKDFEPKVFGSTNSISGSTSGNDSNRKCLLDVSQFSEEG